jgi:hypothetical protein
MDDPDEITQAWALALVTAFANGPHAQTILDVAAGKRRLRLVQHPSLSGWVIDTEAVEPRA